MLLALSHQGLAMAESLKNTHCAGGLCLRGTHSPHRHQMRGTLKMRSLHRTGLLAPQLAAQWRQRAVVQMTVGQRLTILKVNLGAGFELQL